MQIISIAQEVHSAGTVKYTDCFSSEKEDTHHHHNECPGYNIRKSDG